MSARRPRTIDDALRAAILGTLRAHERAAARPPPDPLPGKGSVGWYSVYVPSSGAHPFWAAWWTAPPRTVPWRRPDAADRLSNLFVPSPRSAAAVAKDAIRTALGAGADARELPASWAQEVQARAQEKTEKKAHPRRAEPPKPAASVGGPRLQSGRVAEGVRALRALGLDPASATVEDVQRAFRARAKTGHSDQGGEADMGELVRLRDAARAYVMARAS